MTDEFHIDEWLAEDVKAHHKKDWPAWTPAWDDLIFSGLSDRAVRLYVALGRYAGEDGAWPSRRTLAERLGRSPDSIDRAKDELLEAGWISVQGRVREKDGGQTSNLYRLHQSADVRHPGRTVAAPPLGTGAAPRTTTNLNDNPPTPQTDAVEPGHPIRTQPSTPLTKEELAAMDHPENPVTAEMFAGLRESFRPRGRESA